METDLVTSALQLPLAALVALKPVSYLIRLGLAVMAFKAAMNEEKVLFRVIGLAWLLIAGGSLFLLGFSKGTMLDIGLGLGVLGAAGYAWWSTRA